MSDLIQFDFSAHSVRVIMMGDSPWFVAADVCDALGILNPSDALKRLDDDEKMQVVDPATLALREGTKINNLLNAVSESGLYSLILRSRKPEAKKFKKWVTSEVLPAIRKTGSYTQPAAAPQPEPPYYSTETITDEQYRELRQIVRMIGGLFRMKGSAEFAAWRVIKKPYGLANAHNLPVSEFESVLHHLTELKRVSMQFNRVVTEAESHFFRKNFGAEALPPESLLAQFDSEIVAQLPLH